MIKVENFEVSQQAIRPWPIALEVQRQDEEKTAADLYWLAFFLTGRREISVDIAADGAASPPECVLRGLDERLVTQNRDRKSARRESG